MDEIPTCRECSESLKPNSKFCDECGATTATEEVGVILCSSCDEPIKNNAKFCAECGHKVESEPAESKKVKMPKKEEDQDEVKEDKAKTVKMPSKEPEIEEEAEEEEFDFSEINPATDWECYGQIEPEHSECKTCPYQKPCAKESGVELKEA
jgi:hypothetical protein